MTTTEKAPEPKIVREGHGANCSSLGSVIDTLFLSAVAGGAVLAAVAAALKREAPRIVGEKDASKPTSPGAPK
jgi:hypothetical protein